jgi:hypothetical protein
VYCTHCTQCTHGINWDSIIPSQYAGAGGIKAARVKKVLADFLTYTWKDISYIFTGRI